MTALVVLNSIAALVVVAGLAAAIHFGYLTAGGRFDEARRTLELRLGRAEHPERQERRAA